MNTVRLKVNGVSHAVEIPADMPLLWALREKLNLLGAKYGCGIGVCGSCTVLLDGEPVRSCVLPAAGLEGREILTLEGLSRNGDHPVQRAWIDEDVAQCGYCQGGQILATAALLRQHPEPDDAAIDAALSGHLCRCGTYPRIRKAVRRAAKYAAERGEDS
jgi:aerobic-type carbon monoxide dehydrogenase small subunit (CoxS/CutS family)